MLASNCHPDLLRKAAGTSWYTFTYSDFIWASRECGIPYCAGALGPTVGSGAPSYLTDLHMHREEFTAGPASNREGPCSSVGICADGEDMGGAEEPNVALALDEKAIRKPTWAYLEESQGTPQPSPTVAV
ncbi:hypothetical protein TREES_T100004930 [Tupaia chinensis]|uniref:Uncharacterized protein n=1 Tax=Tupaia chinensis TaxID=246437 RepID=L9LE66_TUPCH|nr:hypothetical protein TREES_T100004930 [Tupaia chinensis]